MNEDNEYSCGTSTCWSCSNNHRQANICSPCINEMKDKYKVPYQFYHKKYQKKKSNENDKEEESAETEVRMENDKNENRENVDEKEECEIQCAQDQ